MVLNDIIADYEFINSTLEKCKEYFIEGQSIIDDYFKSTSAANMSFFSKNNDSDARFSYTNAIDSVVKNCYESIIFLNSYTYTLHSNLFLLSSRQYKMKSLADEISDFEVATQNVINSTNDIIQNQLHGFKTKNMLPHFVHCFQELLSIYNKLKDRYALLANIEQQLFEPLPKGVEESSLSTYEIRSYKNSLDFNDYAEDLRLINRFITQISSFTKFNTPIYTRKVESGSLRIVWSGSEIEINCISDIINALVKGIRSIAFLPSDIKQKKQDVRKASLENDGIAIENISRKLAIVNSQIDILAEKLGLDKNNSEDKEKIQLLCTPLIDYLGNNPIGNINGVEYDLKNDLKYLTCNTRVDE